MKHEKQDPLWQLMGKAKTHEPSPFFVRNVIREVRNEPVSSPFAWLKQKWRLVSAGAIATAAGLALGLFTVSELQPHPKNVPAPNVAVAQIAQNPDSDVIANLDTLVASENNALWLDQTAR